jgi:hypothetical protein
MEYITSPIQREVYQKLLNIDEKAAEAYRGALAVLKDAKNPDRFAQFAHSLREVTLLVSRKVSIPQEIKEDKECHKEEKKTLQKKLEKQFVGQPDLLPPSSGERVKILMRKWIEIYGLFTSVSHHGRDASEDELSAGLADFEAILLQFVKDVPLTMEELDELLAIKKPAEKDVKRLTELLSHPSHVTYFFSRLGSPDWVEPLKKHGFFSSTPPIIREGGYVKFPVWPLSQYLIRVSSQRPKEVMDIIKAAKEGDNFRVLSDFVQCSLKLPSSVAKEIVPLAKEWIRTPYLSTLPEEVGQLCIKLSNEQESESALQVLDALLDVRLTEREKGLPSREAQPYFGIWEYSEILEKVVPVVLKKELGRVVEILCKKLAKALGLEPAVKDTSRDRSYIWKPSVEDRQRLGRDVKDVLVTSIKDSLEALWREDAETLEKSYKILSKYESPIFRRIELHLMRKFPDLMREEIQKALSQSESFGDINLWHEYYHLLREQFANLPREIQEKILVWIDEGPDLENFESWYKEETGEWPTKEQKEARKAHWQIRRLSAIKDALPAEWKERWKQLTERYGEPDHPDYHFYVEAGFAGAKSPLEREEVRKMSAQELIDYFKSWKPPKKSFASSREGLGALLKELLSERLSDFIGVCGQFKTLHPAYTFHFLDGLREAAKKEVPFDWNPVILLLKDILTASDLPEIPADEDRDYDWENLRGIITDLLREGLGSNKNSPPFDLRKTVFEIIEILLQDKEPDLAYEEKYGGENMDAFTLSLNNVRGQAMHVLFQYALWCERNLNLTEEKDKMVPEVKEKLELMLNPEYEPTQTIRAVFGEKLPLLFYLSKSWAENNLPKIFPEDAESRSLWRAAWEAYITYARFYTDVYQTMRPLYRSAIDKLDSPKISIEAKEGLADHLMVAYLWEEEDLSGDSVLKLFFQKAPPEMRGHAVWFIGKELAHLSEIKMEDKKREKFIKRAVGFWEWRIKEAKIAHGQAIREFEQELNKFGIWFIDTHFDKAWAISRLLETLALTEGRIELETHVIDNLRDYVEGHYQDVLNALNLFVKGDREGWIVISSRDKIKEILKLIVKDRPPSEIKYPVNDLVNNLAKKGYHEFAEFFIG